MDWVITLPKQVEWEYYQLELDAVAHMRSGQVLNYRVAHWPKEMKLGDRCWLVWRGKVRGFMEIVGLKNCPNGFICQTSGQLWPPGKYIQRAGRFYTVDGPEMKGFQGIRKFEQAKEVLNAWMG